MFKSRPWDAHCKSRRRQPSPSSPPSAKPHLPECPKTAMWLKLSFLAGQQGPCEWGNTKAHAKTLWPVAPATWRTPQLTTVAAIQRVQNGHWTSARPHHRDPSPAIPATAQRVDSEGWTTPTTTTGLTPGHCPYFRFLGSRLPIPPRSIPKSIRICATPRPSVKVPSLLCRSSRFHRPTTSTSPSLPRPLSFFLPECAEQQRLRNVSYEPH